MKFNNITVASCLGVALIIGAASMESIAQGRGGGRPAGVGGGPPAGAGNSGGVDRGLGTASERSGGRSDQGLGTASDRSNGRSDAGNDRARLARENAASMSDKELNRFRGLSNRMGVSPEEMRQAYHAALLQNPNLRFGHFVAANVLGEALGGRNPQITSDAILAGLARGDSIGGTLRNLGLQSDEAMDAQKDAERRIDEAKKRNKN
ncbi:hypothetical protein BH20ACI2_BH20ACI2_18670 [soil metagenome]